MGHHQTVFKHSLTEGTAALRAARRVLMPFAPSAQALAATT